MGKKYNNLVVSIFSALFVISIIVFIAFILFYPQRNMNKLVKVSIKSGFTLNEISNLLYEKNVIRDKKTFELAAKIMGKEKQFPVGTFKLVNANSNYKIIDQLVNETPEVVKVRILEGWDSRKIAGYLKKTMEIDSNRVIELTHDPSFISQNKLDVKSLEGYYYPDTYFFFKGESPSKVLKHFISQHKLFWNETYHIRAKQLNLLDLLR